MSIVCNLRRADERSIDRLLAEPHLITHFPFGEEAAPPAAGRRGLLARLARRGWPRGAPAAWPARVAGDTVDLDKSWHGLHFLFTGTAWEGEPPACYLVQGGEEIGDVDVGYGPARALRPAAARQFAAFLAAWSGDALSERYDPARMSALDIYPDVWTPAAEGGDSEVAYLLGGFDTLRTFVADAAARGDGVLIYLA